MSNKKRENRKRRRSPWYKMFAKTDTRLSARVTREEDWQTDVPNIRLSRAFVIVLLMHLVVLAAVVAFTVMNPSDANAGIADAAPASKEEQSKTLVSKVDTKKKPVSTNTVKKDDRLDDMRRHIVHSGDSVSKIAKQYGISSEDVHAVNRIDELYQLYQGRVLRIPVSASEPVELNTQLAEAPKAPEAPKANSNGSNFVKAAQSRTQTVVPRADVISSIDMNAAEVRQAKQKSLLPEPAAEVSRPVVVETQPTRRNVGSPTIVRPTERPAAQPAAEKKSAPASSKTYRVVKGDNPFRIAKRFGIRYQELLKHNGITDPGSLQIGQVLSIPN